MTLWMQYKSYVYFHSEHAYNIMGSEDCFYYCSWRNTVVVLLGSLKVQSFMLTEVRGMYVYEYLYTYMVLYTYVYEHIFDINID